jgi:hypothetical protein
MISLQNLLDKNVERGLTEEEFKIFWKLVEKPEYCGNCENHENTRAIYDTELCYECAIYCFLARKRKPLVETQ